MSTCGVWPGVNADVAICLYPLQDEEINQQSQLAEKLKQQMLDQEEVSTGGLTGGVEAQMQSELVIFVASQERGKT